MVHANGRFLKDDAVGNEESLPVVGEGLAGFELVEVLEDGGRMANDEEFILERLIDSGDSSGNGELAINEFDTGDWGLQANGGDFERRIAGSVGERDGLETNKKINWEHNHKEGGGEDFDEAFWPTKRIKVAIMCRKK